MTRNEYLGALGAALAGAEPSVRDDILREMESHMDELAERKPELAEADLVASLSPPASLAAGLLEELGLGGSQPAGASASGQAGAGSGRPGAESSGPADGAGRGEGNGRSSGTRSEGFGFGFDDSEPGRRRFKIHIDTDEIEDSLKDGLKGLRDLGNLGDSIRDAVRSAIRGFGGGTERSSREWAGGIEATGIETLDLLFPQADIELGPHSGEGFQVEIEVEGEPEALASYRPLQEGSGSDLRLRDAPGTRARRIDLRFPASLQVLSVETASGDIRCMAEGKDVQLRSRSGDIEVKDGRQCRITTASGDLSVRRCADLAARSTSGDMEIEDVEGAAIVESSSGEISMEDVGGPVEVHSASGDLELGIDEGPVRAVTASGSIFLRAGKAFRGGELGSKSGDIEVELDRANLEIFAETVSGDIELGGEEADDSVPHRLKAVAGRGGAQLALRSVSGSIEADWS
jgi:hypothetical protein